MQTPCHQHLCACFASAWRYLEARRSVLDVIQICKSGLSVSNSAQTHWVTLAHKVTPNNYFPHYVFRPFANVLQMSKHGALALLHGIALNGCMDHTRMLEPKGPCTKPAPVQTCMDFDHSTRMYCACEACDCLGVCVNIHNDRDTSFMLPLRGAHQSCSQTYSSLFVIHNRHALHSAPHLHALHSCIGFRVHIPLATALTLFSLCKHAHFARADMSAALTVNARVLCLLIVLMSMVWPG